MTDQDVESRLEAAGLSGATAIVESLAPGLSVRLRTRAEIYPASMIKVPIAVVLERNFVAGLRSPSDTVAVAEGQLTTDDAPSPFTLGSRASLATYARAMLSASNNVATNVLIDVLGREAVTRECVALGLRATAVRRKLSGSFPLIDDPGATGRNTHPADDAALLMRRIAHDASAGGSWIYEALERQIWNEKLAAGWQPGDIFAHKTGDTDETSHDGGILTMPDGRQFIVVVYTTLSADAATADRFATFARSLRPLLTLSFL